MAWATLPWLRNFSAFSRDLLLLKAMNGSASAPVRYRSITPMKLGREPRSGRCSATSKVSTRQKQGSMNRRWGGDEGDNSTEREGSSALRGLEGLSAPRLQLHFADLEYGMH